MHTAIVVLIAWAVLAALELAFFVGARRRRRRQRAPVTVPGAPAPGERFVLGGRTFIRPALTTVEQDSQTMRVLRRAEIAEPNLLPGETPDAYVLRIYAELDDKEKLPELLAAALIPDGDQKWSPEAAAELEPFFRRLDDPQDKATYMAVLGDAVLRPFCMTGLGRLLRSPTSGPGTARMTSVTSPERSMATGRS